MADVPPIVNRLRELTKPGLDEHETRCRRYDYLYDVYRASDPKGQRDWRSSIRAKYGMQVIDTALVNIVSGKPRCIVKPRKPEDVGSAKAMQAVIDYHIDEDHFVEKQPSFVQQALIYGTTIAKNHWDYRVCKRTMRLPGGTLETGQVLIPRKVEYVERDGPTFEPWDLYHAWWDPDGRDVDSCRYVVLRSYMSKEDLQRLESKGDSVYSNIKELLDSGTRRPNDETSQQRINDAKKNRDKFELWEVWWESPTGLRVTVIGNESVVIRDEESPYWHGKKPLVITQTRPDLFDVAGIAETEVVDHLQQALWTVQNARFDNLNLTVNRGITYREGGVVDPGQLKLKPGFVWPVQDHDDVKPFQLDPLPPEVYHEEESLLARMQLVTGINPYVTGSDTAGVDQNTATGVTVLNEVASRLLRFKASQIHYKGHQRTYEQWSELIMQLQDREVVVRLEGRDGYEWKTYKPDDVIGSYDIVLEGSEESLSRQQERSEAVALMNVFAPLVQAGVIDPKPLLEKIAYAYDFPNPDALLKPAGPPAAPGPQVPQTNQTPMPQQQMVPDPNGGPGQQLDPRILQAVGGG